LHKITADLFEKQINHVVKRYLPFVGGLLHSLMFGTVDGDLRGRVGPWLA
jgi:hypothetical protein